MTAMLPAHLTETLNNLGDAAKALTDEVRADKEARAAENATLVERQRKQNRRVLALLLVVAVAVAALVLLSVANRRLGMANSQLNRQNSKIVERIESCTTVGGECYEQGRQRTSDAAAMVVRGVVYVQLCLRDNPDASEAQVEACVKERLATLGERDEPPPSGLDPQGEPIPPDALDPAPSATS